MLQALTRVFGSRNDRLIKSFGRMVRDALAQESALQGLSSVREAIVRLIEKGRQSGQIRPDADPDALARILIAVFQGLVLQMTWGEPVDLAATGQVMRNMLRGALFTDASAANPSF